MIATYLEQDDTTFASPAQRHRAILKAFARLFLWPCAHALELRDDHGLRCASCDAPVLRRST